MTATHGTGPSVNDLLAALPGDAFKTLLPRLEPVRLERGQVVHDGHRPYDHVYFPVTAVLSMIQLLEDGSSAEIYSLGAEGMTGARLIVGGRWPFSRVIAQMAGSALRLDAESFQKIVPDVPGFADLVHGFLNDSVRQVTISGGCRQFHSLRQRCARWLLTAHERRPGEDLTLTHESLAEMLGARRATVSQTLSELQRAGAVQAHHARIAVVDAARLAAAACECRRHIPSPAALAKLRT